MVSVLRLEIQKSNIKISIKTIGLYYFLSESKKVTTVKFKLIYFQL